MAIKNTQIFNALVASLSRRERLNDAKKRATNAFNKENTITCATFKDFVQAEGLPAKTGIAISNQLYTWEPTEREVIDPRKWYALWKKKEITEQQFFIALSVSKATANIIVGEDQTLPMLKMERGDKADIRSKEVDTVSRPSVVLPGPIKPPTGIQPRILKSQVQVPAQTRRRIVVRK